MMFNAVLAQVARAGSGGGNWSGLALTLILVVIALGLLMGFARRYKRCPSNKILVIYGKTGSGVARCIHGGAAFVWPLIQAYEFLSLEPFVVPIDLKSALSFENIRVTVPTTVTAAISTERGVMENAAIRLLGLNDQQIRDQAQDIILGQMRAVIATMRIEEINQDRQAFLSKVNESVSGELEKIGLHLVNVNIRDIEDDSGYIVALGRRAAAEAINQANVDVAEQEKKGQIGVATRQRDQRVAVAAASAEAEIGEAEADRNRRARCGAVEHRGGRGGVCRQRPKGRVSRQPARGRRAGAQPLGVCGARCRRRDSRGAGNGAEKGGGGARRA
ncbi:MAG: flotillin family protein [Kiritimatiellia bacterium]